MVHVDDFVFVVADPDLGLVLKVLQVHYELKHRGRLGLGPGDQSRMDMLGRAIEISDEGISWSGDPRHQDLLGKYFGMNGSTKTFKNGYHEESAGDEELSREEARESRTLEARLDYMSQGNPYMPYMQFAAKEACRVIARPKVRGFVRANKW